MAGVFPDSGVQATDAKNTIANPDLVAGCAALWASTSRCQPRFDPAAFNAVVAELVNAVNCSDTPYDCTKLDNLCTAIKKMIADQAVITEAKLYDCLEGTFPDATGSCSLEQLVMTTDAAGCRRIARFSNASATIAQATNASVYGTSFPFTLRPSDPTNAAQWYHIDQLSADVQSNTVDETRLQPNYLARLTITVACETDLDIVIEQTVQFDPGANPGAGRLGRIFMRENGIFPLNAAGLVLSTPAYTNFQSNIVATIQRTVAPGTYNFDFYAGGDFGGAQAAQVAVQGSATTSGIVVSAVKRLA